MLLPGLDMSQLSEAAGELPVLLTVSTLESM
jgi:hypothetical protein